MRTYKRICIKDFTIPRPDPIDPSQCFTLKRGQEYITSSEDAGEVVVHSSYWFKCPVSHFAGEILFTP